MSGTNFDLARARSKLVLLYNEKSSKNHIPAGITLR
jgi:hypothetical protein